MYKTHNLLVDFIYKVHCINVFVMDIVNVTCLHMCVKYTRAAQGFVMPLLGDFNNT